MTSASVEVLTNAFFAIANSYVGEIFPTGEEIMVEKFAFLILPYSRMELPGWGKILEKFGIYRDDLWLNAGTKVIRGKWHGFVMTLDLSNWSERQTYFLGRFYDLPTQLLIREILCSGDSFIDIGANIGMLSLLAARCVGSRGKIYAFEPNPRAFQKLKATVADNKIGQVDLYQCGLSNCQDELILSVITSHTGMGTLADVPVQQQDLVSQRHRVQVYRGDEVLPEDLPEKTLFKIDVEGFEPYVIQGLDRVIRRSHPAIIMEVVEEHLRRANSSSEELYAIMSDYGYEAYSLKTRREKFFLRHRLSLERVTGSMTSDVLWLSPESDFLNRISKWIVS